MAVWIDTGVYSAVAEDRIAITSSKSDVDPCRHGRVLTAKKVRTDGFQLYIVEDNIPVHTEW